METENVVERDLTKERDERCIPLAKKIVEFLGKEELVFGKITDADLDNCYRPLVKTLTADFREKNVSLSDVNYAFQLALQPYQQINSLMINKIDEAVRMCQEKLWGKPLGEVTLQDVDTLLK